MNYSNIHHPLIGGYMPYFPYIYQTNMPGANPYGSLAQQTPFPFSYVPPYYAQAATRPSLEASSFRIPTPVYKNPVPLAQSSVPKTGDPKNSDQAKQICQYSKQRQIKSGDSQGTSQTTSASPGSFFLEIVAEARSNANGQRVLRSREAKKPAKPVAESVKNSVTDSQNNPSFRVQINEGKELVVLDEEEVPPTTPLKHKKKLVPKASQVNLVEPTPKAQSRLPKTPKTSNSKTVQKITKKLGVPPKLKRIRRHQKPVVRELKTHQKQMLKRLRAQFKMTQSQHSTQEEDKHSPYAEIPDLITDASELTKRKQKILIDLKSRLVRSTTQPRCDQEHRILCCNESDASST